MKKKNFLALAIAALFSMVLFTNCSATGGNEGSISSPLAVSTASVTGSVAYHGYSYYQLTGLTAGHNYTISISGMTADVDLKVYGTDSTFTTVVCSSSNLGLTADSCSFDATASSVYVRTYGYGSGGSNYTLSRTDNGASLVDQGSAASPVNITGLLPYAGTASSVASYYMITGYAAASQHTVSMTGLAADIDLYVYTDANFTVLTCSSALSGTTNETCLATASAGGNLYIKAVVFGFTGSGYTLTAP